MRVTGEDQKNGNLSIKYGKKKGLDRQGGETGKRGEKFVTHFRDHPLVQKIV